MSGRIVTIVTPSTTGNTLTGLFVLDSSVLLSGGKRVLNAFDNSEVVIPLVVLRELEAKRNHPDLGYLARGVLRTLEELRAKGNLRKGVALGTTKVRIEINHINDSELPDAVKADRSNDSRILSVAKSLGATLVSKDLPLRILAGVVGVPAQDYVSSAYSDYDFDEIPTVYVSDESMSLLHHDHFTRVAEDLSRNSPVIVSNYAENASALAIVDGGWTVRLVQDKSLGNLKGRSAEQRFAIDHLINEDIKVVNLGGPAGTGKSTLALAAGVDQVNAGHYSKLVIFRNIYAVGGQDLGYLPGTAEEKFEPWTAAVYDAMSSFMSKGEIERFKREEKIEILPLTHIRGRTLTGSYIILDESQNLERSVLLTALTRLGHGSKMVMTGDVSQRDNLHVGRSDGITEVVNRLYGERLFAHIGLRKSERSDVAEMASRLLDNDD